jgi:hypothetical protein
MPRVGEYVPAAHTEHASAPVCALKAPTGHAVQEVVAARSALYSPSTQGRHAGADA